MRDLTFTIDTISTHLCDLPDASNTLRPSLGTALPVVRLVIYICHVLSASDVLAVAITCIACVWCGLDHVAHVSGHVCGEVVCHTCVLHITMAFVRMMVRRDVT